MRDVGGDIYRFCFWASSQGNGAIRLYNKELNYKKTLITLLSKIDPSKSLVIGTIEDNANYVKQKSVTKWYKHQKSLYRTIWNRNFNPIDIPFRLLKSKIRNELTYNPFAVSDTEVMSIWNTITSEETPVDWQQISNIIMKIKITQN